MITIKSLKTLMTALAVTTLLITAGCSEQTVTDPSSGKQVEQSADTKIEKDVKSSQDAEKSEVGLNIYFPDANGEKLIAVKRQINPAREDKYAAAVQALIDGPTSDKEGIYIMPKGTKLLDIKVDNGVATVNFNKAFKTNFSGGSTGELMLIGSIVNTLTDFEDIKSVKFTVEGQELDSLAGHLDLSIPQSRMKNLF